MGISQGEINLKKLADRVIDKGSTSECEAMEIYEWGSISAICEGVNYQNLCVERALTGLGWDSSGSTSLIGIYPCFPSLPLTSSSTCCTIVKMVKKLKSLPSLSDQKLYLCNTMYVFLYADRGHSII